MLVETSVFYCAQIWVPNNRQKHSLEATEINCWRRCCRVTRIGRKEHRMMRRSGVSSSRPITDNMENTILVCYDKSGRKATVKYSLKK